MRLIEVMTVKRWTWHLDPGSMTIRSVVSTLSHKQTQEYTFQSRKADAFMAQNRILQKLKARHGFGVKIGGGEVTFHKENVHVSQAILTPPCEEL